jgi:hypothetical protein
MMTVRGSGRITARPPRFPAGLIPITGAPSQGDDRHFWRGGFSHLLGWVGASRVLGRLQAAADQLLKSVDHRQCASSSVLPTTRLHS